MRKLIYITLVVTLVLSGCSKAVQILEHENLTPNVISTPLIEQIAGEEEIIQLAISIEATTAIIVSPTPTPTQTATPPPTSTAIPTEKSSPEATPRSTPIVTVKPTEKPTSAPTNEPTPKPIAGEGYMDEMTSASEDYINNVRFAINKKRQANGLENAILDSSLSSSCETHAESMASSGNAYHSSNIVGCEGVSKNHYSMPASTLGFAMVAHVGQLATEDTNKIGIGIIYYGDYMYVCIRGVG